MANANLDTKYGDGTGFYVAALTVVTSGAAGTVTEATGGTYARQSLAGILEAAASRAKTTDTEIDFGVATADHGNIVAWGIVSHADAAISSSNLQHVKSLVTPITFNTGYQPKIAAGDLTITEGAFA